MDRSVVNVGTSAYDKPSRRDIAVCFVFFNPTHSKRILMNYLYTVEKLKRAKIPYYTLELNFGKDDPEIVNAFHVRARSVLFHKERLCRLLEQKVPWWYKKLVFLDADIIFGSPSWLDDTSKLLDTHDVVQPFSNAVWMDSTYKTATQERLSVAFMDKNKTFDSKLHPGFAWAFRRSWFREIGFYDFGITGSGDTLSAAAWLGVGFPKGYLKPAFQSSYAAYCKKPRPRMTYLPGKVYHLWHGTHANRKYVDRHKILDGVTDVLSILRPNWHGVFELSDVRIEQKMREYFEQREDDGL